MAEYSQAIRSRILAALAERPHHMSELAQRAGLTLLDAGELLTGMVAEREVTWTEQGYALYEPESEGENA